MANNRMFLVCRGCGKPLMIGKVMSSNYSTATLDGEEFNNDLLNFYGNHAFCSEKEEVHNENQFKLCYEIAWDKEVEELK